jgi:hypothetical protein
VERLNERKRQRNNELEDPIWMEIKSMMTILHKVSETVQYSQATVGALRKTPPQNSTGVTKETCGKPQRGKSLLNNIPYIFLILAAVLPVIIMTLTT